MNLVAIVKISSVMGEWQSDFWSRIFLWGGEVNHSLKLITLLRYALQCLYIIYKQFNIYFNMMVLKCIILKYPTSTHSIICKIYYCHNNYILLYIYLHYCYNIYIYIKEFEALRLKIWRYIYEYYIMMKWVEVGYLNMLYKRAV